MELLRTAIILDKDLSPGQIGNVAAILMGQTALLRPAVYDTTPPMDLDGVNHAGIQFSLVVLKGTRGQLLNVAHSLTQDPSLTVVAFSRLGQGLHNAYEEYSTTIHQRHTPDLEPVGLVISGNDGAVRAATKKFSLLQ